MPRLRVMNTKGDSVLEYTEEDTSEAKAEFDRLVAAGNTAFRVDSPGRGRQLTEFDPSAEEIIVRGPLVGG